MMEYSFPTANGTISSIIKPSVEANNFKIKPSIIQIIRSSVQFSDLPNEDPNKHLINFFEICDTFRFNGLVMMLLDFGFSHSHYVILLKSGFSLCLLLDRESLYDAWERFKSMLRKCPHHELPVWRQVQTFYNGVTLANRATIDAAAGGTIMKKLPSEAFNIIDEIATNLYSYGQERADKRTAGIHSIDVVSVLSAQMTALTLTVNDLGAAMWNGAPIGPCGACGQMGHWSQDCKYPNFSWSNNQQQGPARPPQPRQPPPQEPKSNLEDMFSKFITATDTRFQSQEAAIQNIEVQIGQLVNIIFGRREGQLPSDTEKNPREQVNAISINNGQTIENKTPKEQVDEAQAQKKEEPQVETKGSPLKLNLDVIPPYIPYPKRILKAKLG
ncbi:UNVERIFIED_CONTAM: hypothetical protein Slati_0027300 [Sesamum latifolium]|uniref:CCHC-type domain-containing protein n=1 Tax=Sesamum latifolium TaxID=2727402 RepID=A0AAW2Y6M4_9LAMI